VRARLAFEASAPALDAVSFGCGEPLPESIHAVYRLEMNEWNGTRGVQLVLQRWQAHAIPVQAERQ
jgi:single-stranded-DNA-specific exonuclease